MSSDDVDNHDAKMLPFAACELATDVHLGHLIYQKAKYNRKGKGKKKPIQQQVDVSKPNLKSTLSYIYFENTAEEKNFLSLIPYTGPSNTLHLSRSLYLPQLNSSITGNSAVCYEQFIREYDQTIASLVSLTETTSFSVYIRFGILYVLRADLMLHQAIPLQDFVQLRNRGKEIKTAFYTCKGVTSPKRLLTTIAQLNYRQMSSNTYSYEIQLYDMRNQQYPLLHFQYDEQLQCSTVFFRPDFPINFDFIRNKTSSLFRSIDDSYSDIFDFRIQLSGQRSLEKTDPNVVNMLRGVPIDQVLYIDASTQVLHVSAKLQKYVKYLKCTRSSTYRNQEEKILISIGTYEEYQLNSNGQCEILMKASNIMTIESLDPQYISSAKKLYEIGVWFSNLCQTCVDLPTVNSKEKKASKWFVDVLGRASNRSIKRMNVNQLTIYSSGKSKQTYTSEELRFVKKILQETDLRNLLLDSNEEKEQDRKEVEQRYETIVKTLKASAVPSAIEALQKLQRAYWTVCKGFV